MFDFPNNPAVGDTVTSDSGAPYRWDGVKWGPSPPTGPFLPISGGVLNGPLTVGTYEIIQGGSGRPSQLFLDNDVGGQRLIAGRAAGDTRWTLMPGNMDPETGNNVGANFTIGRYSDLGGYLDTPMTISRATGEVTLVRDPTSALGAVTKRYADNLVAQLEVQLRAQIFALQDEITRLRAQANVAQNTEPPK
jgi:hypothetical protein